MRRSHERASSRGWIARSITTPIRRATSLGAGTAGGWALYFDGSDVALNNASSEDVNGVWIDTASGDVYLSTVGVFTVAGASGDGADIFACVPNSLGPATACTFGQYWDGSLAGFAGEVVDGVYVAMVAGTTGAGRQVGRRI